MNPKFVVSHMDQQMGPFDEQELKMKWAAGEILPIDYVYDEEKEDWIMLADRFTWAAKPVTDDGNAPPPIREVNIIKRTPPPGRPEGSKPAPQPAAANGTPVISENAPVAETLKHAMDIIKYTEISPRKPEVKANTIKLDGLTAPAPAPAPKPAAAPANTAPVNVIPVPVAAARPPDPFLKLDMMMPLAPTDTVAPPPPTAEAQPGFLNSQPAQPAQPAVRAPAQPVPPAQTQLEIRRQDPTPSSVTLVNGVAEIDFTPSTPGHIALDVKDTTGSNIRSTEPLVVNVKALEPVQVMWQYPSYQTVGQDVEVSVRALDERGHLCEHYEDQYMIQIRGPVAHDVPVHIKGGQATIVLNHTKAERWDLTLIYSGPKPVSLPEPAELEWQPGPAVRLVLDGPHEYLAGDPMKVKVKAVDAYGNTAKTYQGTVALEIKAS